MPALTIQSLKSFAGSFCASQPSILKSTSHGLALLAILGLATFSCTGTANAAIMYGDFSDIPPGAVMYLDVEESSFTNPGPPGLYGAPTITGNLLDFDPAAFGTSSADGVSGIIDGQVNFTMMALPGAGFTGFSIVEGGDFSFSGVSPSPSSFVSASAGATVSILEVDGVALASPISLFASDAFVMDYATAGGAPSTGLLPWSLVTYVDLAAALPSGFIEGATKVEVAINNQLTTATAGPGYIAAIAKKNFQIIPVGDLTPNAVPEPASLLGMTMLLVGMSFKRR